jgi:hypothetical protein
MISENWMATVSNLQDLLVTPYAPTAQRVAPEAAPLFQLYFQHLKTERVAVDIGGVGLLAQG